MVATKEPEKLSVREPEAARMIGVSEPTLKRWRATGDGPPWKKAGNVILYPIDKLREWINS